MSNLPPVPSNTADLFLWETQVTLTSNVIGNAGQKASDRVQVDSDRFFMLLGFLGSTNYDSVAGDFIATIGAGPAAARTLVSPPTVPNNFEVMIRYNSDEAMMSVPMPQACLCANGYFTGQQLPYPVLYAPMTTFDFEFWNVAPTLLTQADRTTAINLEISFALYGYFIPTVRLAAFLRTFEPFAYQAQAGGRWIEKFTKIQMNGVPGL